MTQINTIRNERGEVMTDTTEIQKIVRIYYEQLYANKLDNLGEMDKFLEIYNFSKLNQEESENQNRPMTTSEIGAIIKKHLAQKIPGQDSLTVEFYQTFKKRTNI